MREFKNITGFSLSYKNMSPNVIASVKVNEVVLTDEKGTVIDLGNVDVGYSILSYLKNQDNPLAIIRRISLNSLNLDTTKEDLDRNINLFNEKLSSINKENKKSEIKFDSLLIELKDCNLTVNDKANVYAFNLDRFQAELGDGIHIKSTIDSRIKIEKFVDARFQIYTDGMIYDLEKFDTVFNIDLNKLDINSTGFKKQKFVFTSKNETYRFERNMDLLPVKFVIEKNNDLVKADLKLDNLKTRDMVITSNRNSLNIEKMFLDTKLTYDVKSGILNGNFLMDMPIQELFVFRNSEIKASVNIKDNLININDLSLVDNEENNMITLKGAYPLYKADYDLNLKLKDLKFPSTKLNADFYISKRKSNISAVSDFFLINGIDLGQLAFLIEEYNDRYSIGMMKEFNGYSFKGEIYNRKGDLLVLINHNFNSFNLKPLISAYNESMASDYIINGNFSTNYDKRGLNIDKAFFTVNDLQNEIASFNINLRNNIFNINNFSLPSYNVSSTCSMNLNNNTLYAKITKDIYDYSIRSSFSKEKISLNINRNLEMIFNPVDNYVYLNAKDFALPYRDLKVTSSFIYDINSKRIFENYIGVDNLKIFPDETGSVTSKMSYENDVLKFYDLVYTDRQNRIIGMVESRIETSGKPDLYINGSLKDESKSESYWINVKLNDKNIDGKFQISHMDIRKIVTENLKGFVNLRFSLYGDINNPNIDLDGEITEGKLSNSPLKGMFSVKKMDNKLLLKKINFQLSKSRFYISNSDIVFGNDDSANINISGNITLDGLYKIFKTDFYVRGLYERFSGEGNTSLFSSLIQQFGIVSANTTRTNPINLDIGFDNMNLFYLNDVSIVKQEKFGNVKFNLSRNDDIITFKNYGKKFVYYTSQNDDMTLKFYDNDKTVLNAQINTKSGNLDGKVSFKRFPVNSIEKIIDAYADIEAGYIDGEITLKGKTDYPEFFGKLYVYYGIVGIPTYLLDKIENVSGIIIADKNKFLVNNVNGNIRDGQGHGYGEIIFNGWNFENYTFHVNSDNVPAYVKIGPVDAKGIAYIEDFLFDGGKEQNFNFIATLGIPEAEVNLASLMGIEGTGKITKLPVLPINVEIKFIAGDKVRVNYPIIKGNIEKGNIFTLRYAGLEPNVYLGGMINMNKGEIYYFNKTFKLEQGVFEFDENDPRINPLVNVKSYYRTRDSRGEQVKILLNLNERLLSFKTSLSSLPFKTQDEINGLLGVSIATVDDSNKENGNLQTTNNDVNNSNPQNIDTIINTTNYISNAFLFSPIENNIRRITTLDTFSLNTGFFGNILKQNSNFLDLLDDTNLSVGKYVSNEIYLGSMMTFNKRNLYSDKFFYTFPDNNYGLNLQLMLQVELPYISFGYSYVPKDTFKSGDHVISMELDFKF